MRRHLRAARVVTTGDHRRAGSGLFAFASLRRASRIAQCARMSKRHTLVAIRSEMGKSTVSPTSSRRVSRRQGERKLCYLCGAASALSRIAHFNGAATRRWVPLR